MTEAKKYQLQDLIEKIDQVDSMIKLHADNPSSFMLEQYEAKKQKLLGYLIDELIDSTLRSPYSFRIIVLALQKYYPEVISGKSRIKKGKNDDTLKDLEAALV